MTEKQYGGATSHGKKNEAHKTSNSKPHKVKTQKKESSKPSSRHTTDIDNLIKAGEISKEVKTYAKSIIKPGIPLLEIAEKIESKIIDLGGKPAFPTNLSINEIAAHFTPSYNEETKAHGLLKVDLGVHINGYVADTAFSLDLENSEENKKLIEAAEAALKAATTKISLGVELKEIGSAIEKEISSRGFKPIINLSGHQIEQYNLHAGLTIPNHDNSQTLKIQEGTYAIEPFATPGLGTVRDGKPSGIYILESHGQVRDNFAREVLEYIAEEYQALPFCSRWLVKKFGTRALLALSQIERAGILHHFPQLIEKSLSKVSHAEHTIVLTDKDKIITT